MLATLRQEKRRQERFTKRCEIEFSPGCQTYVGIASNFSSSGLFIRIRYSFIRGTIITMVLHLPHGSISKLTGRVMRAHKMFFGATWAASGIYSKEKDGMGVEIIDNDSNYVRFIRSLSS